MKSSTFGLGLLNSFRRTIIFKFIIGFELASGLIERIGIEIALRF